jgi:hypothetical protein
MIRVKMQRGCLRGLGGSRTRVQGRTTAAPSTRQGLEIGEGGMATVYLAEDLKHHRKVALKVLKPELSANRRGRAAPGRDPHDESEVTTRAAWSSSRTSLSC